MDYKGMGFVVGFIVAIAVLFVIRRVMHSKTNAAACDYDERQIALRNAAYQKGFITTVFVGIILGGLEVAGVSVCTPGITTILSVFAGICVFVCVAIYKDAYFGLNQQKRKIMILFAIIGIVQWINVICDFIDGEFLEHGKIGFSGVSLGCAAMFTLIVVMLIFHHEPVEDED